MTTGLLEVMVTVGLPASGKTTFAKKFMAASDKTVHYFCPDDHLYQGEKYVWSEERVSKAWGVSYEQLAALLCKLAAQPHEPVCIIWDATLTTPFKRLPLINFCIGAKATVTAYYFPTPLEVCLNRNAQRPAHRRVPDHTILRLAEHLKPPTVEEGFAAIKVIT